MSHVEGEAAARTALFQIIQIQVYFIPNSFFPSWAIPQTLIRFCFPQSVSSSQGTRTTWGRNYRACCRQMGTAGRWRSWTTPTKSCGC